MILMFMLINHFFCKTREWALESTSVLSMLTVSSGGVSARLEENARVLRTPEGDATTGLLQDVLPAFDHSLRVGSS